MRTESLYIVCVVRVKGVGAKAQSDFTLFELPTCLPWVVRAFFDTGWPYCQFHPYIATHPSCTLATLSHSSDKLFLFLTTAVRQNCSLPSHTLSQGPVTPSRRHPFTHWKPTTSLLALALVPRAKELRNAQHTPSKYRSDHFISVTTTHMLAGVMIMIRAHPPRPHFAHP